MNRPGPEEPDGDRPPWGDAFATPDRAPVVAASRDGDEETNPGSDPPGDEPAGDEPAGDEPADPAPDDQGVRPDLVEDDGSTEADTAPPSPGGSDAARRRAVTAVVAAVVVLTLALSWWLTTGRVPSEVSGTAFAGSLGIINDLDLVEQRALAEARDPGDATVGESDAARTVARCVRVVNPALAGPLRLAAEVRANGQDAIVLLAGANGPTDVRIVDRDTCAPLTP